MTHGSCLMWHDSWVMSHVARSFLTNGCHVTYVKVAKSRSLLTKTHPKKKERTTLNSIMTPICEKWSCHMRHDSWVMSHETWPMCHVTLRTTNMTPICEKWRSIVFALQRKMTTMTFSCVIRTPFGFSISLLTLSVIFRFRWLTDRLGSFLTNLK